MIGNFRLEEKDYREMFILYFRVGTDTKCHVKYKKVDAKPSEVKKVILRAEYLHLLRSKYQILFN